MHARAGILQQATLSNGSNKNLHPPLSAGGFHEGHKGSRRERKAKVKPILNRVETEINGIVMGH
jgi:hypothetical protein